MEPVNRPVPYGPDGFLLVICEQHRSMLPIGSWVARVPAAAVGRPRLPLA